MIDWIKIKVPINHAPIASSSFMLIDPDGVVERTTVLPVSVMGSYSSKIQVRSVGAISAFEAEYLEISGNPAKFLQGHNVFGSNDAIGLCHGAIMKICDILEIPLNDLQKQVIKKGDYYCNWIDINESFSLDCISDVRAWLRAAEFTARTRQGRPTMTGGTLYFQKKSRRWAIKGYSKGDELKAGKSHGLPPELESSGLMDWAQNILRIELRLLGKELRTLGIDKLYQLDEKTCKRLYGEYMNKIYLPSQVKLTSKETIALTPAIRSTYTLWRDGHYMQDILSTPTFYRHRKMLMEFGVDISIACAEKQTNVIPLVRVLEANPVGIPQWAVNEGLVYQSKI